MTENESGVSSTSTNTKTSTSSKPNSKAKAKAKATPKAKTHTKASMKTTAQIARLTSDDFWRELKKAAMTRDRESSH